MVDGTARNRRLRGCSADERPVHAARGLCLSFKSANNVTISLSAVYRSISGVRGDGNYDYENDADFVAPDMIGAGYAAWDTGITVKWAIGQ
jgi:hypothetical protein